MHEVPAAPKPAGTILEISPEGVHMQCGSGMVPLTAVEVEAESSGATGNLIVEMVLGRERLNE